RCTRRHGAGIGRSRWSRHSHPHYPAARRTADTTAPGRMSMADKAGARILIIDDEAQIRRFLGIGLRAQGYDVAEAANGRDGLEALATRGADLVILDLGLPDLDGQQALRELRGWSSVPVVVLSVRSSESEKVAALDNGANDYVTKPFGVQELSARLRALLRASPENEGGTIFDDGHLRIDLGRRQVQR